MLRDKVKIAVFVSGGGTNLQALLEEEKKGAIPDGEIVLVLSSKKDAYALTRAENFDKKAVCVDKQTYPDQKDRERQILKILKENQIDLVVLAGYLSILGEEFVKEYSDKIINVHPSLIPSFCGKGFYGLKVHQSALDYGVKVTGATVHYVNEIPDGGKIILQKAVYVQEGDTAEVLQKRVMEEAEWVILPKACEQVCKILRNN